MKEWLKSISLVVTTLLISLPDTTIEGMSQRFKTARENLDRNTNSTKKILEKVGKMLELFLSSPQNIITIAIASIISISSILGLILVTYIIRLIRNLRQEEESNVKLIKISAKDGIN